MQRRIFVSFVYEDAQQARGFTLLPYNRNVDFDFVERHLLTPAESQNPDYIRSRIREELNGTSVTVVLIGKTTARSNWIDFEIRESLARGNGVIGIKLKGCENAEVPRALEENGCRVINWEPQSFSEEIEGTALIAGREVAAPPSAGSGGGGGGSSSAKGCSR